MCCLGFPKHAHGRNCLLRTVLTEQTVPPNMLGPDSAPGGATSPALRAGHGLWLAQGPGPLSLHAEHNKEHGYYRHLFLLKVIPHNEQTT